jgi:magnesium transporter
VIAFISTRPEGATDGRLQVLSGEDMRQRADQLSPDVPAWIDVSEPDDRDIAWLGQHFAMHPMAVRDIQHHHQRPKLDQYDGSCFGVLYAVGDSKKPGRRRRMQMHELQFFVTRKRLVTIHWMAIPAVDDLLGRIRAGTLEPVAGDRGQPLEISDVAYELLDGVVDGFFPALDSLAEMSEDLEEEMFSRRRGPGTLQSIFELKKDLFQVRKVVAPARDVFNVLLRRDQVIFPEAYYPYLQDLYDRTNRVIDGLDVYRDLLSTALDTYLSFVSNDVNQTVKKMTAVTAILMVDALIAGVYGMNFRNMPELDWTYGYLWALSLMVASSIGLFFVFRRYRWW